MPMKLWRRWGLMNQLKETNITITARQESVDHANIAASSWFIAVFFLITTPCCKTFRFNECQSPQTIRNTPQALKLSISLSKLADKPTDRNNACSKIQRSHTKWKAGLFFQMNSDKAPALYLACPVWNDWSKQAPDEENRMFRKPQEPDVFLNTWWKKPGVKRCWIMDFIRCCQRSHINDARTTTCWPFNFQLQLQAFSNHLFLLICDEKTKTDILRVQQNFRHRGVLFPMAASRKWRKHASR